MCDVQQYSSGSSGDSHSWQICESVSQSCLSQYQTSAASVGGFNSCMLNLIILA